MLFFCAQAKASVRFTKDGPGARSGDRNRTDVQPFLGLANVCSSFLSCMPRKDMNPGNAQNGFHCCAFVCLIRLGMEFVTYVHASSYSAPHISIYI